MPRFERADLSGTNISRHATYDVPTINRDDYWANVTGIACPVCHIGVIQWHEAGYVSGSRLCDGCGRFFQARGSIERGISLMRDVRFDKLR